MNVVRYEPWGLMNQLHSELERMFDHRYGRDSGDRESTVAEWVPAVDIKEEDGRFVIHADVPGVEPKDIEITMEDGVLTLRGQRESERREEQDGYRRVERVRGQFYRRFTLPDTADAESISAKSTNGVLEVIIPKHAKVQPRRITVKGV